MLHACDSDIGEGHKAPPALGDCTTERVRVWVPPPQTATEHADQADQSDKTQSFGHSCVLHDCDCVNTGHGAPRLAGCCVMVRVCVWVPPPHLTEQSDQVDQPLTAQFTGHGCVLHGTVSVKAGHAKPPLAGDCVTTRVWV